jgi:hypothetical protein
VSNVPGIFAAYRLYSYKFYALSLVLFFSAVVSALYHFASSTCTSVIGMDWNQWGIADFWLAFSSIIAVSVLFSRWTIEYYAIQSMHLVFLMIIMLILVLWDRTSTYTIVVIVSLMAIIVLMKFIILDHAYPPHLAWANIITVLFLGAAGITMFFCCSSEETYWWIHSLWHIFIYMSAFFAVDVYNPFRRFCFWRLNRLDSKWHFRLSINHPHDWYDFEYCGMPDGPHLKKRNMPIVAQFRWNR